MATKMGMAAIGHGVDGCVIAARQKYSPAAVENGCWTSYSPTSAAPEFIYRHQWHLGDLVFWDNRCTILIALGGIKPPGIRHLHRTSIAGDAPF